MLATLGITDRVHLQLNTLGSGAARVAFRQALLDYLQPHAEALDPDSQRRLQTNPLRILDKVPATQAIVKDAPQLIDFVDAEGLNTSKRYRSYCNSWVFHSS